MKQSLFILLFAILTASVQPAKAAQPAPASDSSTVRLYRIPTYFADQYIFEVFLNDSPVYRAVVGTRTEFSVPAGGKIKLVARKDKNSTLTLIPKAGEVCYVRCEATVKGSGSQPQMTLMGTDSGSKEFDSIQADILPASITVMEKNSMSAALLTLADTRNTPLFTVAPLGGFFFSSGYLNYYDAYSLKLSGFVAGLDVRYNVNDSWSAGLLFQNFRSPEPASILFAGPIVTTRTYFGINRSFLEGGAAFCYMHIHKGLTDGSVITAWSFAPVLTVDYAINVTDFLSISPGAKIGAASVKKYTRLYPDGREDVVDRSRQVHMFNVSFEDIYVSLRFNF